MRQFSAGFNKPNRCLLFSALLRIGTRRVTFTKFTFQAVALFERRQLKLKSSMHAAEEGILFRVGVTRCVGSYPLLVLPLMRTILLWLVGLMPLVIVLLGRVWWLGPIKLQSHMIQHGPLDFLKRLESIFVSLKGDESKPRFFPFKSLRIVM
jgi:hypothetical protein